MNSHRQAAAPDNTVAPERIQPKAGNAAASLPLDAVVSALGRLRYGTIQLTVHDGRLVQVDVTERTRFG